MDKFAQRLLGLSDQSWAGIRDDEDAIRRIADDGPDGSAEDARRCQRLAVHVLVELWRSDGTFANAPETPGIDA